MFGLFFTSFGCTLITMTSRLLSLRWLAVLSVLLIVSCKQKKETLFESLPASTTHIDFKNTLEKHKLFNILYYLYYYNGGGVATGDINNDGLPDLYFTANHKAGNKLYLNKGNFQFEDITEKAGVAGNADWCTGVTMTDVNGDGYLDIYVSVIANKYTLTGHNLLFVNNKNNTFTEKAKEYNLDFAGLCTQAAFFDYDHDGDLDCYLLNQSHHPHSNIVDTSNRHKYDSLSGDRLYCNNLADSGRFTDVSAHAGIYQSNLGYGLGLAIADINQDGWEDIYIGNDFHENDYYYINNGNGTFAESGAQHFRHYSRFSMGNDIADYNNDGQPDIVTVDMLPPDEKILKTYGSDENPDIYKVKLEIQGYQKQYSKNSLQRNNGRGISFSETSLISGVSATDWSWSPLFADFDNDGNKDLFISSGIVKRPVDLDYVRFISDLDMKKGRQQTDAYDDEAINGMPDGSSHPFFFKGDGKLTFEDVSESWGTKDMKGYYNGAAYADLDNDGALDVVINCIDAPAVVLKNKSKKPNQFTVDVKLKGDKANRFGIGAKVWLFSGGRMQYQQLMLTRGFQSSCDTKLHFGLDTLHTIDSMLIVWPSQKYQLVKYVPAKEILDFSEIQAGGVFNYDAFFPPQPRHWENITAQVNNTWRHAENDFFDYNRQYLIPHMLSDRGPHIAVGDVNHDGLDDLYACGALGQPGQLMLQQSNGQFQASDTAVFNKNAVCEEVDALFFDANKDGHPDLYVVSGGNQYLDGNPKLLDHLYLNDGSGHFREAQQAIPILLKNKSCISASDADHDGDLDLFIGGLADAKQYGVAQPSYLLLNDGTGNFTQANASVINLQNLGMVTSSAFADLNADGWDDLVVAGEWMSVKIFLNNKGVFRSTDLPATTGLWQSVQVMDFNGDGKQDILAGNWGHNTKLWAGKNGPCKLYVKDFDNNGSVEQILCYTINGNEYTFLAKDELERPLPVLKKSYLKYSEVAGKTVQYMFYNLFKDYTELKAEVLGNAVFLGDGKGGFNRMDLPDEYQLAPLFAFLPYRYQNKPAVFTGGNFYGVIPYEGRYDALLPGSLQMTQTNIQVTDQLPEIEGEVRDLKWIKTNGGNVMVMARNNAPLLFFKRAD